MPAKHVLSDVCEVVRRSDVFHIDPDHIHIVEGWNPRTDFSGEDELVESIKENGVQEPLRVRKSDDKKLELVSGERRLRAVRRARKEGADIISVPVIVTKRGTTDADLFIGDLNSNGGKPLLPTEEADAFKRLVNWGFSVKYIHQRTGKSISHIRNRLELANASPDVKKAVDEKQITIGQAQDIAKTPSIDDQKSKLDDTKAKPKIRRQNFCLKKGIVHVSGFKGHTCRPLNNMIHDIWTDSKIREEMTELGFDPDSVKISVCPLKTELQQE